MSGQTDPTAIYEEWVPMGPLLRAIALVSLIVIAGATAVTATLSDSSSDRFPGLAISGGVFVFLVLVLWNYRGIRIRVTRDAFEARYGLFNRTRIAMEDVIDCAPDRAPFGRYLGIGVRGGLDGSWAYTTSFGDAVRVTRTNGRPLVVSSREPGRVCEAVAKARSRR